MDNPKEFTVASLCTGYGGLELGLKRVIPNMRTVVACEIEAYAIANMVSKIESGQMGEAFPIWTDIKTFPSHHFRGKVHCITAGYPCQCFSTSGKRKGKEDSRYLWPYIRSAIDSIRPLWVFCENVRGHVQMGLRTVLADLAELGYSSEFGIFSASEVGAPHERERVFFLSYLHNHGTSGVLADSLPPGIWKTKTQEWTKSPIHIQVSESLGNAGENEWRLLQEKWQNSRWPAPPGFPRYKHEPPCTIEEISHSDSGRCEGWRTGRPKKEAGRQNTGTICKKCGGWKGHLGLEPIPDCLAWAKGDPPCYKCYVCHMRTIFSEIYRVLRPDGTFWLNLGDSYCAYKGAKYNNTQGNITHNCLSSSKMSTGNVDIGTPHTSGFKTKDKMMIPARVAMALQSDGWYLRSDIIWQKPSAMPESVKDRPTRSYENLYLLTKSARYYYNADAIREPIKESSKKRDSYGYNKAFVARHTNPNEKRECSDTHDKFLNPKGRNKRDVWTINSASFKGAHFAVMPSKMVETAIKASTPEDEECFVLDPFSGVATVGVVAIQLGHRYLGIELSENYAEMGENRLKSELSKVALFV